MTAKTPPPKTTPPKTTTPTDVSHVESTSELLALVADETVPDAPEDDGTQWIVFREPVTETVEIVSPDTGKPELVTVSTTKEHRVPISEWPAYERAHGWA
jgi:hypothetical protein